MGYQRRKQIEADTTSDKQVKAILDKLHVLNSDPPLFFIYCNDVDIVKNFASAISTILTLTPHVLNYGYSVDDPTSVMVALTSASSLLSSVIDTLTSMKRSKKANTNMLTRTVGRAIHRKRLSLPLPELLSPIIADTVQREADAVLSHVQRAKDVVTSKALYDKAVAAGCFDEKYECSTPQSVNHALIAHVHRLVDALLALSDTTSETISSQINQVDPSHRQHQVVNGQLGTGAICNGIYRSSADLSRSRNYDNNNIRASKRKSAETAGSRFMRSISSSFKSTTSVVTQHETQPQSSKSSIISDRDDGDHWRLKHGDIDSTSSLSIKSVSQNSTSSPSKNAIRTFLGSATTIVRHGRDHQIAPFKPPSKVPTTVQSMTWRHLFTPGLVKKNPRYDFPMDSASSGTISSQQNRRSYTSDHATETVKIYTKERQRWSDGDDTKYSISEICMYNGVHRINSRRLSSDQKGGDHATIRSRSSSGYSRLFPAATDVFRSSNDGAMNSKIEIYTNLEEPQPKAIYNDTFRRSFSSDDDELEMLTMGTYGPLTPASFMDSPTQLSPTERKHSFNEETDNHKEDTNLDRISTHSSSYFSARSYSSHSSLQSARSISQPRILDVEMARYHASDDCEDKENKAADEDMKNSKYATITPSQKQQSSTLLSKAMIFAEQGRSSPEEQNTSSSYRSVGTIGISNLSSVLSRHWSPHRRTTSVRGTNKRQTKAAQYQRRNPLPFSISDADITHSSSIQSISQRDTYHPQPFRSLDIQNRLDFCKPHDELNHVCENGHVILITQPVSGDKQKVIAGTGDRLFMKLIDNANHDLDYVDTYLLSHQAFISSIQLFDALKDVFKGNTWREYQSASHRSTQLKIISVITRWIKLQYENFSTDKNLLHRLHLFLIHNMQATSLTEELATIKSLLEVQDTQCQRSLATSLPRTKSVESLDRVPPHIIRELPRTATPPPHSGSRKGVGALALSSTSSALASLDAKDVAQYLTLADFNVFKAISPYEYLRGTWRSNTYNISNPQENGYAKILTRRANMLSHWVLHEVCSPQHPKQRRMIIRKLIHIAKLCIEWNNFHTGMIIVMGLQCPTIQRLEDTWQALTSRDLSAFEGLQKYLDVTNNMGFYRQSLAAAKAPVVPFFPLILKDLTFFMDGNPTMATPPSMTSGAEPSPKLINFDKFRVLTQFVNTLMRYTTENYWFSSDLEHCPFLPHISITRPPSQADVPALDRVAELVEIKIRSVESCYEDSRCSTQWVSSAVRRTGKQVS